MRCAARFAATLLLVAACRSTPPEDLAKFRVPDPAPESPLLHPEKVAGQAPDQYAVELTTTKGALIIDVTRRWAPHGADRFYNLVKAGYYDKTAFFRVLDGFMAQVGLHGSPAVNDKWRQATIPDDEPTQSNTLGMVTFAKTRAPNSRTTQFFINYADNSRLDEMKFAPFGKVRDMKTAARLYDGYGEGAPMGSGPAQSRIMRLGNDYLIKEFPRLDYIVKARILEDPEGS